MAGMGRYLVKRGIDRLILIITVVSLQFILLRVLPVYVLGFDPTAFLIDPNSPPEVANVLRKQFGLDEPVFPHQFARYTLSLFTLQFGYSFASGKPVIGEIMDRLPNTVALDSLSMLSIWAIALIAGLYAARKRGSRVDSAIVVTAIWSYVMPAWLMGLIMLMGLAWAPQIIWGVKLFPIGGTTSPMLPPDPFVRLVDYIWHLSLPLMSQVIAGFGWLTYYMRSMTVSELGQDYVVTARAKGVKEESIMRKHILKSVSAPVLTVLAMGLPGLMAGGVIFESIFSWYGMGRYMLQSINSFDYPAVQAVLFLQGLIAAASLYLLDIAIVYVDPRVRLR
jgi:peptide/nickel transport system permease protein